MIGNLKKYIDKASFMEHIDAKLRQNEPIRGHRIKSTTKH